MAGTWCLVGRRRCGCMFYAGAIGEGFAIDGDTLRLLADAVEDQGATVESASVEEVRAEPWFCEVCRKDDDESDED